MSNRIIKDQYSDGTTVDGNRLQRTLDEVEERINNIPRGDLSSRYIQQSMVLGFLPSFAAVTKGYPWNNIFNVSADIVGGDTTPVVNTNRTKGCYNPSLLDPDAGDKQYAWSTSVHFVNPVILRALHMNLITDSAFGNPLGGNGTHIIISVDSDGEPTDRHLNSYEVVKHLINDSSHPFRRTNNLAPVSDMTPAHPKNIDGNIVSFDDLDLALPALSRVRIQLVIPRSAIGWGTNPDLEAIFGSTLYWDEEII